MLKLKKLQSILYANWIAAYSDLWVLGLFLQTLQFFTYCRLSVLVLAFQVE